jgi:hypothetical protein
MEVGGFSVTDFPAQRKGESCHKWSHPNQLSGILKGRCSEDDFRRTILGEQ